MRPDAFVIGPAPELTDQQKREAALNAEWAAAGKTEPEPRVVKVRTPEEVASMTAEQFADAWNNL